MLDDAELLRRYAAEKSEDAFAEVVRRHVDFVYAAALRQVNGDAHLAQDIAQTVFTDLARKAGALASHRVLAGWLHTSTRFAAAKAVRGEQRRHAREQEAYIMQNLTSEPTAPTMEWERLRPEIDRALHALSERDREAVLLRFFEGRAFPEVGARLSLTADAARLRVERALAKMRMVLARRGLDSTTAALAVALANQPVVAVPAGFAASVTGAALASTATTAGAGAVAVLGSFFAMSKINVGILTAIVVAVLVPAVVELRANRALRAEFSLAQTGSLELGSLQRANARLSVELGKLSAAKPDVGEIARLHRRAAQLSARPDGVVDSEMRPFQHAGRDTPAAAMETFVWALVAGDQDLIASFIAFRDDTPEHRDAFMASFSDAVRARYRTPELLLAAALFPMAGKIEDPPVAFQVIGVDEHVGGDGSRAGQRRVRLWARTASGRESEDNDRLMPTPEGWAIGAFSLAAGVRGSEDLRSLVLSRIDPITGEPRPIK